MHDYFHFFEQSHPLKFPLRRYRLSIATQQERAFIIKTRWSCARPTAKIPAYIHPGDRKRSMESAREREKLVTRAESAIRATPALNGSERSFFIFSSPSLAVASCLTQSWKRYRKLWVRFTPRHIGPGIFWMGHADVRAISLKAPARVYLLVGEI